MLISSVGGYKTYTLSKRRVEREDFGIALAKLIDVSELKKKVLEVLEGKGRVYGVYSKKVLVGVYMFERLEHYFIKTEDVGTTIGEEKIHFEGPFMGESTAAYRLKDKIMADEVQEHTDKIEKDMKVDFRDQISFGRIAGVEWGDILQYRKNLKREKDSYSIGGYFLGFAIGMMMGWTCFDSLPLGLCFGVSYAMLWGGCIMAASGNKSVWATFDLISHEYHQEGESEDAIA